MVNLIAKQSAGLFSGEQLAVRLFTPVRSARGKEISLTAVSDKGAALDPDCPQDNLPFFTRIRLTEWQSHSVGSNRGNGYSVTEKPVIIGWDIQQNDSPELHKGRYYRKMVSEGQAPCARVPRRLD